MARPPKINPILETLDPSGNYSATEVVSKARENGSLASAYPDAEPDQAAKLARRAIVSHIHRHGIAPIDKSSDPLCYAGADLRAHLPAPLEPVTAPAADPPAIEQTAPVQPEAINRPTVPRRRIPPALAVVAAVAMLALTFLLYPEHDRVETRIKALQEQRDIAGLRRLSAERAVTRAVYDARERRRILADIERDLGIEARMDPVTYRALPDGARIAAAIADLEDEVIAFAAEDVVAVFAHLDQPMWVVAARDQRYHPLRLGDWVDVGGIVGYITRVGHDRLELRTEQETTRTIARPAFDLFGLSEKHGRVSLIYARTEGNLAPLLAVIAEVTERELVDESGLPGQMAGFFPPFRDTDEILAYLTEHGIQQIHDGNRPILTIPARPRLRLITSFHEHYISMTAPESTIIARFASISPVPFEVVLDNDPTLWYTGQSFEQVLADRDLLTRHHEAGIELIR